MSRIADRVSSLEVLFQDLNSTVSNLNARLNNLLAKSKYVGQYYDRDTGIWKDILEVGETHKGDIRINIWVYDPDAVTSLSYGVPTLGRCVRKNIWVPRKDVYLVGDEVEAIKRKIEKRK